LNRSSEIRKEISAPEAQIKEIDAELKKCDDDNKRFIFLCDILEFFKKETTGIFDEADVIVSLMNEINSPSGREKPLSKAQLAVCAAFSRHIAAANKSQGTGIDLFGLSRSEQAMLSDAQFTEHQDILVAQI
jgi:hypothetical protein